MRRRIILRLRSNWSRDQLQNIGLMQNRLATCLPSARDIAKIGIGRSLKHVRIGSMTTDPTGRLAAARRFIEGGRFSPALEALRRPFPGSWEPERRFLRGEAERGRGRLGPAASEFGLALKAPVEGDPALWFESALGLVSCLRSIGRAKQARRWLGRARAAAKRYRLAGASEALSLEDALLLRAEGRWPAAVAALRRLRRKARGDRKAFLDWALGGAFRFMGRLSESAAAFERARAGFRRAGDRAGAAYAEMGLAGTRRVQGRLEESVRRYGRALETFGRTEDLFGLAYANCGLANGLRQSGRLHQAERFYSSAHRLYSELGDPADLAYVDWGLAEVRARTGRSEPARTSALRALAGFASAGEARGEVLALRTLSALEHARGRTSKAERLFDRAVRLARASRIHTHLESFT